jgi:hypothetical protein
MPTLVEKINQLKCDVVTAARLVEFWNRQINTHGEHEAERFYLSLGLNHIERKGVEWEGLTLSREPKEHEKIAVKGIANAQESAKESIGKVLLTLRSELIEDGLKGIKRLKPATYHELTLQASSESRSSLRDRLISVHRKGRLLIAAELSKGKAFEPLWGDAARVEVRGRAVAGSAFKEANPVDEFDELDDLADLTDARIANDVQSRIIAAATRFRLLGLTGNELITAITNEITAGTVTYIDRASTGLANKVINIGRMDEAERRRDEWGRVEYSALLDQNVCGPCASEDGDTANNEADLTPTPNPECEGGDWCRCFHVYVQD